MVIRMRWTGLPLLLVGAGLAAVLTGSPAGAGAYTVNTTADTPDLVPGDGLCADAGGSCSLRAAIVEANARPGDDEVSLPAGTFTIGLTGDDDDGAVGDLDLNASDGTATTITGAGAGATVVDGGGVDRVFHLVRGSASLAGLTIRNGVRSGGAGGGVLAAASTSLTLRDLELRGNAAGDGGGLRNEGATILTRVLVAANSGSAALSNGAGTLTVVNSTVSTNSAPGVRSTGGGIGLTHVTITGNAGGITVAGGNVTLRNSIVAANDGDECSGAVGSQGHNVVEDSSCGPTATDRPATDPGIAVLAANGGPTQTHGLVGGSPAIDLVGDGACPVADDQRGVGRPIDGDANGSALCDAGAFEAGGPVTPSPGTTTTTRRGQLPPATPRPGRPTTAG